jgi:signal transduction histidine kinase
MDRNWLRWLGIGSICGRLILLLTMASLLVGISYRYMQFNILKGVLYEQIDSTLRTRMILLTNLTSLNFTESQTKRLMQPLLEQEPAPLLEVYFLVAKMLKLDSSLDDRQFAGIWQPEGQSKEAPGRWIMAWNLPAAFTSEGPAALTDDYRVQTRPGPNGQILVTGSGLGRVTSILHGIFFSYFFSLVLGVLIFMAATFYLARLALRPVANISDSAREIANGNLNLRLNTETKVDELKSMGASLNIMLDQLQHQAQAQAAFTADISHELGNPLNTMLLQTQLGWEEKGTADDLRLILRQCHQTAQRMNQLRESLLELSQADAATGVSKKLIALEPVVDEAILAVRNLAVAKGVDMVVDSANLDLHGNPDLLHQLLVNLLTNAIRHTPEGSAVTVRSWGNANGSVGLRVLDQGKGVNPEDVPALFSRFFHQHNRAGVALHGHGGIRNGLGLAICHSIVKAHGGTITYTPGPQGGALFEILLPGV